jgi:hypothetical protein
VACCYDAYQIQGGHNEQSLSTKTKARDPEELAAVDQRPSKPPLIAVKVNSICRSYLRRRGLVDPLFRYNPLPIPQAAVQNELTNFRKITGP